MESAPHRRAAGPLDLRAHQSQIEDLFPCNKAGQIVGFFFYLEGAACFEMHTG